MLTSLALVSVTLDKIKILKRYEPVDISDLHKI